MITLLAQATAAQSSSPILWAFIFIGIAVIIFFAALLNSAILKGQRRRDRDGEEAFG